MTEVTLTALRKDLFRLVDSVLETGEPLVIRRGGRRLTLVAEAPAAKPVTPEERWDAYMAQGVREGAEDWADDIDTNKSHWSWDPDAKFDFGDK